MNSTIHKTLLCFFLLFVVGKNTLLGQNDYLDSLLKTEAVLPADTKKVNLLNEIGDYYLEDNFINALKYGKKAKALAEKINFEKGKIEALINICYANDYLGRYAEAQKQNYELLSIFEQMDDSSQISTCYNNIGIIHYYLGNYKEAIKATEKALAYYEQVGDTNGVSICYNNLANSYADMIDYPKALEYYQKALELDEAQNNLDGVSLIKGNIGEVYTETKEYDKAYTYLIDAVQLAEKSKDRWQMANMYASLGDLLSRQNKHDGAYNFLIRSASYYKELNANAEIVEVYDNIAKILEMKGDLVQSMHYLKMAKEINEEIYNKESSSKIAEMNALYEIKEKETELLKQEAIAEYQKSQKTVIIIGGSVVLALLLVIVVISIRGNISKKKINETLEVQKKQIETKNQDITDSIQYAKRIQSAILPTEQYLNQFVANNFVLYLPKDIVAGDFYWMHAEDDLVLLAAADCTGHGVPGAMVSVVCNNALNRAVREFNLRQPAKILDKVRELVIETFEQSDSNIKDGMDIALISLPQNGTTKKIAFAGANNPLWIVRNSGNEVELIETKGDKQPIGKFMNEDAFTNHEIELQEGDKVYMLTDGFPDQFGGEKGKKYKYRSLKEKLISLYNSSLQDQKNRLHTEFDQWKGDLEQIDDVCIIGLEV